MIRLVDNHDLESLLRIHIHLLCLRNLLQKILDDNAVVVPNIRGCDFEVVNRSDDVEFEFAVGGGEEDAGVDFYLLDAGAVEGFQRADDACLLSGAGWAIDEEMGKVAGLCLGMSA